jgi:peptidyl-tRNA hydrolase
MPARDPDPYVLYLVVRTDLKMGVGKIAAQCSHAVQYFLDAYNRQQAGECTACGSKGAWFPSEKFFRIVTNVPSGNPPRAALSEEEQARINDASIWKNSPEHTKIVLGANDKQFETVKKESPVYFSVIDLGFTQVAPNTETVLALWPMRKSKRSPILTKLRPLT